MSSQGQSDPSILIEDPMKIIHLLRVKFRKLRGNKVIKSVLSFFDAGVQKKKKNHHPCEENKISPSV